MSNTRNIPADPPLAPKKRAVVVGASSGIGEAVARKLAKEGYLVALLARRKEALDSICAEINQEAGESLAATTFLMPSMSRTEPTQPNISDTDI